MSFVRARSLLAVAPVLALLGAGACGGGSSSASSPGADAGEGGIGADGAPSDGAPALDVDHPMDGASSGGDSGGGGGDAGRDAAEAGNGKPVLPTLTNAAGGTVLKSPKVYYVFVPGYPYESQIEDFAKKLSASTYWATTTSEYGVGGLSYRGAIEAAGQTDFSSAGIQKWLAAELAKGTFGTPDPETIYTLVYPQGTALTQPNPVVAILPALQSCTSFGGYHDNVQVQGSGGTTQNYAYAVIATCNTSVGDLTATLSHEWVEASTDPYLTSNGTFTLTGGPQSAFFNVDAAHIVWAVMASGGEAGDLCQPEAPAIYYTPSDVGYLVQRTWSNAAAAAGHDPCVPEIPGQPYFQSAPVLNEAVTISSSIIGTIPTMGVKIPVGQSKTIDVDLTSDGATSGPWTVQAVDLLYTDYGSQSGGLIGNTLSFQWDKTSGVSGDTLHLTITVTGASILGNAHAFQITSTLPGSKVVTRWAGVVTDS